MKHAEGCLTVDHEEINCYCKCHTEPRKLKFTLDVEELFKKS